MTPRLFAVSLFSVVAATATPTFTDTGSATTYCLSEGSPAFTISATGSTIDLLCPTPDTGPEVRGYAGNLATGVSIGYPWIPGLLPSFSFQSSMTNTLTPTGGNGAGTVEFTVTYNFGNVGDDGVGITAGDFQFNGSTAWSRSDVTCLFGESCWDQAAFHHNIVTVIDEPVTYGTPFTFQGDMSSTDDQSFFLGESNYMTVDVALTTGGQLTDPAAPITTPEPSAWTLVLVGLGLLRWGLSRVLENS